MRAVGHVGTLTPRRAGPRGRAVVTALCATVVAGTTACTASGNAPSAVDGPPARVAELLEQDYAQAASRALPSVVEISTSSGLGSGVVFDDAGHVLTNAHVVGNATSFQVRLSSGTATYPATLVYSWPPDDLAVIKLTGGPPMRPAAFGRSSDLVVGDIVIAMGNPFGLDSSVTEGVVSALGRTVAEPPGPTSPGTVLRDAIQTSAPINPGNSGGALVNLNGEVIGIPTLAAVNPEAGGAAPGIGFAVPSDLATDLARQIVANGKVVDSRRAALGLSAVTVTDNSGQPVGVGVTAVQPGGPAAKAGIKDGDVITMIDKTEVKNAQQLQAALAEHRPGDVVQVTFIRPPGGPTTVPVTLGELPTG
jgi:S1-C subfamily serine protease